MFQESRNKKNQLVPAKFSAHRASAKVYDSTKKHREVLSTVEVLLETHFCSSNFLPRSSSPAVTRSPQLGFQPSAPAALQFQSNQTSSQVDIKNSLARLELQYSALAAQVSCQQEAKEQQKIQGAPGPGQGAPRLNQYVLV